MSRPGVLFINVGTPDSPEVKDVENYLKVFLMDRYVVDLPFLLRCLLVHVAVLPRRKYSSSELYKKIWTPEGSPLLVLSKALSEKFSARFGGEFTAEYAMRIGNPSIEAQVRKLMDQGVTQLIACPLFPQYSEATTRSVVEEVERVVKKFSLPVKVLNPFFNADAFIQPYAQKIREKVASFSPDLVLMSFHGLPERQVKRLYPEHCLKSQNCCDTLSAQNAQCYRAQCMATARNLARAAGLSKYEVSFQSRLGRTPWIQPYSDQYYRELPQKGVKRLVVVCPSFVADCLETLEEVAIQGKKTFLENGGEEFFMIPCLNDDDAWVKGLYDLILETSLMAVPKAVSR